MTLASPPRTKHTYYTTDGLARFSGTHHSRWYNGWITQPNSRNPVFHPASHADNSGCTPGVHDDQWLGATSQVRSPPPRGHHRITDVRIHLLTPWAQRGLSPICCALLVATTLRHWRST
ncbi:hypothetical protein PCASD_07290 [Puccinia coronata f. sp. avenae]|uniref:Uncharacterized protein n=1 Tax=Puccinia coronata f. sp. avenae TaxID=200324 RepID=A0A2N5URF8_9BASI|nr:hypothetical protein PCASD_07290 [Puccinia coronata f. sp. avenae]